MELSDTHMYVEVFAEALAEEFNVLFEERNS
jgi:hypothetical protein